jgi:putative flippase GtrA
MASAPDLRSGLARPLRFLLAGGLNTLFGFAVFGALVWAGWSTWACLLVGNLAGTAFNFLTLGGFVFRDLHHRRFPRFVAVYGLIYLLNLGLLTVADHMAIDRLIAQFCLLIPMAAMSYVLMSRLVFQSR